MYTPTGSNKLSDLKDRPQIRLGIQGFGGTGKTWSALTFKNPVVLNLDRGLGAHYGREDVIEVPMHDPKFCAAQLTGNYFPWRLRDAILVWLAKEGGKLEKDQTLVIDSLTSMQNAYHLWYAQNKVVTSNGKIDDFAEWKLKLEFFTEIMETLKKLACDVVLISHEAEKREKDGTYRGKIRPLLTGSFGDELLNHFTDWYRQRAADKPDMSKYEDKNLAKWGFKNKAEMQAMCDRYPRNTIYFWQTASDDECDTKCSSLVNYPTYIPADYQHFALHLKHK